MLDLLMLSMPFKVRLVVGDLSVGTIDRVGFLVI